MYTRKRPEGDVAGDTSTFFANRFLGDLDQDLLAFLQQVSDQRIFACSLRRNGGHHHRCGGHHRAAAVDRIPDAGPLV